MDQATRNEFYRQYHLDHMCCPSCGGTDIGQTTIGYLLSDPATYQDGNRATCTCGWKGVVHDKVPLSPYAKLLRSTLAKYIRHVGECEGVNYVPSSLEDRVCHVQHVFTAEELALLHELEKSK